VAELLQRPLFWVALAYFVGAIPNGVVLARLKGIDLRKVGSGNIGATNAARALGTKLGLLVFFLDAGKAATPVFLASQSWALGTGADAQPWLAVTAFMTVFGHIFPVYLKFRGGKGVACALGIFVALDPLVAVAAMIMYVQGTWLTRTSAVGSLTAVTAMTLCLIIADKPIAYQGLALAVAVLIWLRHTSNIKGMVAEAKERKRIAKARAAASGE
jgi:glycerol-3-phosphate acyltransferase PlsY